MRKILRELKREFPTAKITITGHNHYRLTLGDGRLVIVSGSPGDSNFMRHVLADARRQSRKEIGQ